ncbi:UNVERIFIED_ORG: hypothetical protein BDK47_11811 [Anoxybacillus amylolyticus]
MEISEWKTFDTGGHVEVLCKDVLSLDQTPVMVMVSSDCVTVVKRISRLLSDNKMEFSGFLTLKEYEDQEELYWLYGYETSEILLEKSPDGKLIEKDLFQMFGEKEREEIRRVFENF